MATSGGYKLSCGGVLLTKRGEQKKKKKIGRLGEENKYARRVGESNRWSGKRKEYREMG